MLRAARRRIRRGGHRLLHAEDLTSVLEPYGPAAGLAARVDGPTDESPAASSLTGGGEAPNFYLHVHGAATTTVSGSRAAALSEVRKQSHFIQNSQRRRRTTPSPFPRWQDDAEVGALRAIPRESGGCRKRACAFARQFLEPCCHCPAAQSSPPGKFSEEAPARWRQPRSDWCAEDFSD